MINGLKSFWESASSKWLKILSLVFLAASITIGISNYLIQGNEEFKKNSITFILISAGLLVLTAFVSLLSFFSKRTENKPKPLLAQVVLWVLGVGGIGIFVILILLKLGLVEPTNNFITTLGVALPVFVTIGYGAIWITYNIQKEAEQLKENRRNHRRNHTLNILLQSRLSDTYQKRLIDAAKFYPSNTKFPDILGMPSGIERTKLESLAHFSGMFHENTTFVHPEDSTITFQVDQALYEHARAIDGLNYLLNYFEFVSIGIKNEDLDEGLLEDSMHWILIKLLERCEHFIKFTHEKNQTTKIWENAIQLGAKWKRNLEE